MSLPLKGLKHYVTIDQYSWMIRDFSKETEIPVSKNHPASFLYQRKNHQHEGIDLYCENGQEVIAMVSGIITNIIPFTGEIAGYPWWSNTYGVVIEDEEGVWIYGELQPLNDLKIGKYIEEGSTIGHIIPVLKNKKNNRPIHMLHLERYQKGIKNSIGILELGKNKPDFLLDPIPFLLKILNKN